METNYTPGPFTAQEVKPSIHDEQYHYTIFSASGAPVARVYGCAEVPEIAAMFAAAPELADFAQSFLEWLEQMRKVRPDKDLLPGLSAREREARAALAKAGVTP